MAKRNTYLADLEDKFTKKHNEIARIALVIAADDEGIENVDALLERFLQVRLQVASDLYQDAKVDGTLTYTKYDIARRLKTIINWAKYRVLFPLLKDYWEDAAKC